MATYAPPYRDIAFVIDELLGAPAVLARMEPFRDLDGATIDQIVREAGPISPPRRRAAPRSSVKTSSR